MTRRRDVPTAPTSSAVDASAEHFERRFEMIGRSLAVPMRPFPDETLQDFIVRAAADNGFTNPRTVIRLIASNSSAASSSYPFRDSWITPEALADTLGMRRSETAPPLEQTVRRGYQTFFGSVIRRKWITGYRRFSPMALRSALYNRAIWSVLPFAFDPVTRQMLIDRCPICASRMKYKFTMGLQYCDACAQNGRSFSRPSFDLRDANAPIVEVEDEEGLEIAVRLLDPSPNAFTYIAPTLHADFSSTSRSGIFELMMTIGSCLSLHGNVNETISANPAYRISLAPLDPKVLAEAGRMILNWPSNFKDFIGYVRVRKGLRNHPFYTQFISSALDPDLSRKVHDLIKDERAASIAKKALGRANAPNPHPETLTYAESVASLRRRGPRVEMNLLKRLADSHDGVLSRVQVQQVALANKRGLSNLVKILGVPSYILVDLVGAGLLPAELVDVERATADVAKLGDALVGHITVMASKAKPPEKLYSLYAVMIALSLGAVPPWTSLLSAVARGDIEFWLYRHRSPELFKCVWVNDLKAVCRIIAAASEPDSAVAQLCVSTLDAALTLGVAKSQMWDFKEAGLVRSAMTLRDLMRLRQEYLFVSELVPRVALGDAERSAWSIAHELREASIHPIRPPPLTLRKRVVVEDYFGDRLWPCYQDRTVNGSDALFSRH